MSVHMQWMLLSYRYRYDNVILFSPLQVFYQVHDLIRMRGIVFQYIVARDVSVIAYLSEHCVKG